MTEASDRCGLVKMTYIAAMKDTATKPMSTREYRSALRQLGISQVAVGRLFGYGSRTPRRWALGEARVPIPVAVILRLMLNKELQLEVPIWNEVSHEFDTSQIWELTAQVGLWE